MADRRQVELIRSLHELRDARKVKIVESLECRRHLQAGEIFLDVLEFALLVLALRIRSIKRGALPVLVAELRCLEEIERLQIGNEIGRVLWQLGYADFGDELADEVALEGRVVEEDDRVEADAETLGERSEVVGLVVPVRDETADIGLRQDHVRVAPEGSAGLVVVVLAADAEDDPAPRELLEPVLELDERLSLAELTETDAFEAVVSDHSATEDVVQVVREALGGLALDRSEDVDRLSGHLRQRLRMAEALAVEPEALVEPRLLAEPRRDVVGVDRVDVLDLARQLPQPLVDLADGRLEGAVDTGAEVPPRTLVRHHELMHDDRHAGDLRSSAHDRDEVVRLSGGKLHPARAVARQQDVADSLDRGQDDDEIGLELVQPRRLVEHRLVDGVVLGLICNEREPGSRAEPAQDRGVVLRRAEAEHRDPSRVRLVRLVPAEAHEADVVELIR